MNRNRLISMNAFILSIQFDEARAMPIKILRRPDALTRQNGEILGILFYIQLGKTRLLILSLSDL